MRSKYPIRKLSKVNILVILALVGFQFLISNIQRESENGDQQTEIRNSIIGIILMLLIAFSNTVILLVFEKALEAKKQRISRRYFILTSYLVNVFIFNLVIYGRVILINEDLDFSGIYYLIIIAASTNTLSLAIQNYVIMHDAKIKAEMENSQLKVANAEAANLLLKQQIHPHFLFNSLNVLKSLYKKDPETAEEYLVSLSDFLRAAISNNNIRIIRLKDEIKLCLDYLELQKIRFGEALDCTVTISEEKLENGFVPSFSIQPLIENAIKHNELTTESPLRISIEQDGERVKVTNNLKLKTTTEGTTGSGLVNLSERYRLLSGDELIIEQSNDKFSVCISILKSENQSGKL